MQDLPKYKRRVLQVLLALCFALILAWAFWGYTQPGVVLNFATLLQMCGLR